MKTLIALLTLTLGICAALASEIIPPDIRVPQLVREAHKSAEKTTLWGVDYEQIQQSDNTMTAERMLALLKSIDPDRIKLGEHAHLATVIKMVEPKGIIFTFEARDSKSIKGPPTHYFLIKLEETKSNKASDATSEPAPVAASSAHQL